MSLMDFQYSLQSVALRVVLKQINLRTLGNDCFHNIYYCAANNWPMYKYMGQCIQEWTK